MQSPIHYIPIATTILALLFAAVLFRRYSERGGTHLLWWSIGGLTYACGTFTESLTTLWGWHEPVFRAWYITGALLGGAPLAQGSVYLHLSRRVANTLTVALVSVIVIAAACVILSPINLALVEPHRLSGKVLTWHWVRLFSPFLNLYAVLFLVGGALVSAWRFAQRHDTWHRFVGNVLIAIGAILPGIGGAFTRFGHVEVLYVTEFIGLALIFIGYRYNVAGGVVAAHPTPATA
ncbi:MAG: hypothetical protein JO060_09635 [Candidatus Eremiobacteraeota bacterium]|nr:hypothetical protein [Candidatus Eremiobacteraeota bacterium]